jgi:RNA polymerase sigma-70 factor (ECF subfamily)
MTRQAVRALRPAGNWTDRELLERFVTVRDESAFAALVQRHGAAVLRVCRRVLASRQDAEDVCQAAFLTLARKAGLVPWQDSVSCWLQAVARRLALQARCSAARRGRFTAGPGGDGACLDVPEPSEAGPDPLVEEVARRELRVVLDEELGRLPEKYRVPVVLCYLEGKTNEQAAGELGWPIGSMSRRLARARALLRDRLSRRGLTLIVVFVCLTLAGLWPFLTSPTATGRTNVAGMMALLGPGGANGDGLENTLRRAAEHEPSSTPERERLLRMAQTSADIADVIANYDAGRRREDWVHHTMQMRLASADLTEALANNDSRMTQRAARQLLVTCLACHTTFRD